MKIKNKNQNHGIQQTLTKALERAKVKTYKEPQNQEIRQAIAEWIIINNLAFSIIQSNICPDDALNSGDSDLSVNVANSEKPILHNIAKIKTRWNSKYYSWKQLLKLPLKFTFAEFEILSDTPNDEQ
ncbi:4041_t:CDS:2, partial [Dentiscutata erythropus]